ncbi:MAG: DUF2924 domain-containing protein [Alphaproteobacteria bacterium]|nr:DUF2924 domain-containing protein [Alphaproteobacteria bacterium]
MIPNTKNDLSIIKQIIALQSMDENSLRNMWDKFFDYKPEVSSRQHMISKIAYKIQELAYGGVDPDTEEKIREQAKKTSLKNQKKKKKFQPQIGTKIVKEYHDKTYEVLVVNDGFAYEGNVFKSLSAIANKITGTKWNGLKFFGVKV